MGVVSNNVTGADILVRPVTPCSPPLGPKLLATLFVALTVLTGCGGTDRRPISLGVPTTVDDSGLLQEIRAAFEEAQSEYRLKAIAGGSGQLMSLAALGDLDVFISHSPVDEIRFMEAGHGISRLAIMENDFIIVGPAADPAGVRGMRDAAAALERIGERGAPFLSRGDDSGTHRKELELWEDGGEPERGEGYRAMGDGMAAVLRASSETASYTLTDRGTYLANRSLLNLQVLVEGDERLRNVYSVILVAEAREVDGARAFTRWLVSEAGKEMIRAHGRERFGRSLFEPIDDQ